MDLFYTELIMVIIVCHNKSLFWNSYSTLKKIMNKEILWEMCFPKIIVQLIDGLNHHHHHVAPSVRISLTLSPPLPIIHCFCQVLRATSCISTELLYVFLSWSSCLCSAMWKGPWEYIIYELVPTSPTVSHMSGSSNFDTEQASPYLTCYLLSFA